jgi:hypothetical protein
MVQEDRITTEAGILWAIVWKTPGDLKANLRKRGSAGVAGSVEGTIDGPMGRTA